MSRPYLNEAQLVCLINLSQCTFQNEWDITWSSCGVLIQECPDFVSNGYIEFKLKIKSIKFHPLANQSDVEDVEKAKKDDEQVEALYKKIVRNWKSNTPLFKTIKIEKDTYEKLDDRIQITVTQTKEAKNEISTYLKQYIALYEGNELYRENENTVQPNYHLMKFIEVVKYFSNRYGRKRVKVDVSRAFEEKKSIPSEWDSPIELPFKHEYRFTEFFLFIQKKGYIRILEVVPTNGNPTFGYQYVIDIFCDPKQILTLEQNWYSYGSLRLQPISGHVFNWHVKPKLKASSAPFKLLKVLIEKPEEKFDLETLEKMIYPDQNEKSASQEQLLAKIQDAAKQARKVLKMNEPFSSVNIFGKDHSFWLGAIPDRKAFLKK